MDELTRRAQPLLESPLMERTPIVELRRRAQRRRIRRAAGTTVVVIACLAVAGVVIGSRTNSSGPIAGVSTTTRGSTPPRPAIGAPQTFVSTRVSESGDGVQVAISDARSGNVLKTLLTIPSTNGTSVSGTAIAPSGDVWVTVNSGPKMLGHVAGGDPQPHTCLSKVLRIDPRTGVAHTVLQGGDNELILDAQPSPTGNRVAYLHSGCATSFFDYSIRIKDLSSGHVVSIGADLPRCHFMFSPRWTVDGRNLAIVYAEASTRAFNGAQGTCSQPKAAQLALVSADRSQNGIAAVLALNGQGCEVNAVAVTKQGYAAVEHCGREQFINGPTRLVRYDRILKRVSAAPLGRCEDGASLGGDPASESLIVSTYQFCAGGIGAQPTTKLFADTGRGPSQLAAIPGGYTAVEYIAY
jgi:hypothetical protein